ncbi:MAG: stage III sporulation protein SpoIIIAB [bacterium]
MYIKLIGATLILFSGTSIGWILSNIYINRIKELKELQLALSILETEISYGQTVLPEALKKTSKLINKSFEELFYDSAEKLKKSRQDSFAEIWEQQIKKYNRKCDLNQQDLEILINWGQQIGCSDLESQIKINQLALKRLEQQEEKAHEIARKKVKIVRYAGVLISLMVIILFY